MRTQLADYLYAISCAQPKELTELRAEIFDTIKEPGVKAVLMCEIDKRFAAMNRAEVNDQRSRW
jgi:protein required for attachment to host cells